MWPITNKTGHPCYRHAAIFTRYHLETGRKGSYDFDVRQPRRSRFRPFVSVPSNRDVTTWLVNDFHSPAIAQTALSSVRSCLPSSDLIALVLNAMRLAQSFNVFYASKIVRVSVRKTSVLFMLYELMVQCCIVLYSVVAGTC
jgi:hypothetical protein